MTDDELIEWLLDWGRIGEEPVLIEAASRIKKLVAANLQQSLIKVDDMRRIEKLEEALQGVIAVADRNAPEFRFARKVLEGKYD